MGRNRIKGITIELGGDTTGLDKALKGTNDEIRNTQAQLKDVQRLLKLDPGNTELLAQKQRLLTEAIADTGTKLDTLREAASQAQNQLAKGQITQEQYEALQREIIDTENSLQALEKQAAESNSTLNKMGSVLNNIAEGADKVAEKTKGMSIAAGGTLTAIGGAAYKAAVWSDDLNTLAKQSGFSTAELQKMQYAAARIDVDISAITSSAAKMRRNMVSTSAQVGEAWKTLGVSVRDSNGNLRDSNTVFYEVAEALSKVENETERDTLAMMIFGKSADALAGIVDDGGAALKSFGDEAEEAGLILNQETVDGLNAVNDQIDEMKAKGAATLTKSGAAALQALSPVIDKVIESLDKVLSYIGSLDQGQVKLILTVLAVITAISPVAGIISEVSGAMGALLPLLRHIGPLVSGAGEAISGVLKPILSLIMAHPIITAIIALVTLIAVKGDEIQAVLQKVDDFLQNVFARDWRDVFGPVLGDILNGFFSNIKNVWNSIKQIFDGIINFIRGVFTGDWKRAWEGVKDIFGGILSGLASLAKVPINALISLLNAALSDINKVIAGFNKIGGKIGLKIKPIGDIPYLAKGGELTKGTAIVGEAGPEILTVAGGRAIVRPLSEKTGAPSHQLPMGGDSIRITPALVQIVLKDRVIGETVIQYQMDRGRAYG